MPEETILPEVKEPIASKFIDSLAMWGMHVCTTFLIKEEVSQTILEEKIEQQNSNLVIYLNSLAKGFGIHRRFIYLSGAYITYSLFELQAKSNGENIPIPNLNSIRAFDHDFIVPRIGFARKEEHSNIADIYENKFNLEFLEYFAENLLLPLFEETYLPSLHPELYLGSVDMFGLLLSKGQSDKLDKELGFSS
jgi:hypothetical protein